MRKQGGIFQKWFSSFANAVFIQSFHAVILTFALKFLKAVMDMNGIHEIPGLNNTKIGTVAPENDISVLLPILAFICLTAITRFEKVLKDLFGIGQSQHLGDTRGNFKRTMMGVNAAVGMGKNVLAPVVRFTKAGKDIRNMKKDIDKLEKEGKIQRGRGGYVRPISDLSDASGISTSQGDGISTTAQEVEKGLREGASAVSDRLKEPIEEQQYLSNARSRLEALDNATAARSSGDNDRANEFERQAAEFERRMNFNASKNLETNFAGISKERQEALRNLADSENQQRRIESSSAQKANLEAENALNGGKINVNNDIKVDVNGDKASISANNEGKNTATIRQKAVDSDIAKKQDELIKRYNEAVKARNVAIADTFMNAGSTFAGVGFAAGAWDEFHEITNAGNMISQPFVSGSTAILNGIEDRKMKSDKSYKTTTRVQNNIEVTDNVKRTTKVTDAEEFVRKNVAREQARANSQSRGRDRQEVIETTRTVTNRENVINKYEQVNSGGPIQQRSSTPRSGENTSVVNESTRTVTNRETTVVNNEFNTVEGKTTGKRQEFSNTKSDESYNHDRNVNITETTNSRTTYQQGKNITKGNQVDYSNSSDKENYTHEMNVGINELQNVNVSSTTRANYVEKEEASKIAKQFLKNYKLDSISLSGGQRKPKGPSGGGPSSGGGAVTFNTNDINNI